MVSFAGAKLHYVDFSGCITEGGMINLKDADILNVTGIDKLRETSGYQEALKSFGEDVHQEFKKHNIPAEQLKPIEEDVKELEKEVKDIQEPEKISSTKKEKLNVGLTELAREVSNT